MFGEARGIQQRSEGNRQVTYVWTFRVERYDRDGNRLPPVPVELRGYSFEGAINEGDTVEVDGAWRDGTIIASVVRNRTTGAVVRARQVPKLVMIAFGAVAVAIIAGILIIVVTSAFSSDPCQEIQARVDFERGVLADLQSRVSTATTTGERQFFEQEVRRRQPLLEQQVAALQACRSGG